MGELREVVRQVLAGPDSEQLTDVFTAEDVLAALREHLSAHPEALEELGLRQVQRVDNAPSDWRRALGALPRAANAPRAEVVIRRIRDAR